MSASPSNSADGAAAKPRTLVETYASTSETTRSTARWVMTSLGGVGVLLVAGLGLSSLTGLHNVGRLLLATLAVLIALTGVAWAIAQTASVLKPSTVKFEDIVAAEGDSSKKKAYMNDVFSRKAVFLQGLADDFADMQQKFEDAQRSRAAAWKAAWATPENKSKKAVAEASEEFLALHRGAMLTITANAAAREISGRSHTWRQIAAAAAVTIGVVGFALVVAWPSTRDRADFHGAKLTDVNLNGVRLTGASFARMKVTRVTLIDADLRQADFSKASLDSVSLLGAHTDEAKFDGVRWIHATCPDGTLSDRAGGTCNAHMKAAVTASLSIVGRCIKATIAGKQVCVAPNRLCVPTRRANRDYRRYGFRCVSRGDTDQYRLVPD